MGMGPIVPYSAPPAGMSVSIPASRVGGVVRPRAATCLARAGSHPRGQILVSEFMLQQTRWRGWRPICGNWVARWPTPSATAAAGAGTFCGPGGKSGLSAAAPNGCTNARRADRGRPRRCGSRRRRTMLLTLPGIGAYTARAVARFAYQHGCRWVDTNVRRAVARRCTGARDAAAFRRCATTRMSIALPRTARTRWRFSGGR